MFQIHFHKGNNETIYKYFPKECLPQDYGGELPTLTELQGIFSSEITNTICFFLSSILKDEHPARAKHHLLDNDQSGGNIFLLVFKRP